MAGYRETSVQSESVQIGTVRYYVCAECRYPIKVGHATVYDVPVPGKGLPGPNDPPQALCDVCYRAQYSFMYPKAKLPHVHGPEYHPVPGEGPIPWDKADWTPRSKTDIELFEEALTLAKNTGEKPEDVLAQLKGEQQKAAEVTVT